MSKKILTFVALFLALGLLQPVIASESNKLDGKKLAFDRKKGNCLACHMIADGTLPGNLGPPLLSMKLRFPNKADLRARVYDATKINPLTAMPPFGKFGILTDEEIDAITDFIHNL